MWTDWYIYLKKSKTYTLTWTPLAVIDGRKIRHIVRKRRLIILPFRIFLLNLGKLDMKLVDDEPIPRLKPKLPASHPKPPYLYQSPQINLDLLIGREVAIHQTKSRSFRDRPKRPQEIGGLTRRGVRRRPQHVKQEAQFTRQTKLLIAQMRQQDRSDWFNKIQHLE